MKLASFRQSAEVLKHNCLGDTAVLQWFILGNHLDSLETESQGSFHASLVCLSLIVFSWWDVTLENNGAHWILASESQSRNVGIFRREWKDLHKTRTWKSHGITSFISSYIFQVLSTGCFPQIFCNKSLDPFQTLWCHSFRGTKEYLLFSNYPPHPGSRMQSSPPGWLHF